ncbi:hypothetical protein ABT236_18765 [Streptomyces sp. NPDC001523]|uniref:hypothetical protein n=1 Tax=Streptomyces sp. NPDC001523 TaxID=3154383 RepID=UPI00331BF9F1
MPEHSTMVRDVAALKVARVGRVEKSDDPLRPFRLVDADGTEVAAVSEFLHHMLADDASPTSLRSYAYELLAWVRFLRAVDVPWHLASRVEARDFALWIKTTKKPPRRRRPDAPAPGSVNPVTGKAAPGDNYAARTRRHARAVIRSFYATTAPTRIHRARDWIGSTLLRSSSSKDPRRHSAYRSPIPSTATARSCNARSSSQSIPCSMLRR